jgi:hypothetical protein
VVQAKKLDHRLGQYNELRKLTAAVQAKHLLTEATVTNAVAIYLLITGARSGWKVTRSFLADVRNDT